MKNSLGALLENMSQISAASNEEVKLAQDVSTMIEQLDDVSKKLEVFMKEMF